jgi:hypothetical protein
VTLQRTQSTPFQTLQGWAGLDLNLVQADSWATTYAQARSLADAVRAALNAQNIELTRELDEQFDPFTGDGLFRVSQEFRVFTTGLGA